jgi:hypothetical protein
LKNIFVGEGKHYTAEVEEFSASFRIALPLARTGMTNLSLDLNDEGAGCEVKVDAGNGLAAALVDDLASWLGKIRLPTESQKASFELVGAAHIE